MAGFFIVLGDIKDDNGRIITPAKDVLTELCHWGMYSTNLPVREGTQKWSKPKVSTFTDYFSMRENDFVFFFSDRKIYGAGRLVNVGDDCKYWSFEGANRPQTYSAEQIAASRLTESITPGNRCICFFEPVEYFSHAIDMDEALTAFPDSFKSLRTIQGRTFIKLGDEEAMALFAVLHRRNVACANDTVIDWNPPIFERNIHTEVCEKVTNSPGIYKFSIESLLENYPRWEGSGIKEEMAIEAAVVNALSSGLEPFDRMSYVTHQVSASPAKPVEYMEWMDIFGYSISDDLSGGNIPIQFGINKYYVMEIKREFLHLQPPRRGRETKSIQKTKAIANQLMKYVDWIAKNYASGNYPMVKGVLIANGFDNQFIEYCQSVCIRNYNIGYRNSTPAVWQNFELIRYSFDGRNISFERIFPRETP